MNEPGKYSSEATQIESSGQRLCEVCVKNDDEDLYIVFNVLYRAIMNEIFSQTNQGVNSNFGLESMEEEGTQRPPSDTRSSSEKLKLFQEKTSTELLKDIINSTEFDELLKEIFSPKYSKISEANCSHEALLKKMISSFTLQPQPEEMTIKQEKVSPPIQRLQQLLNSIRQVKNNIQNCNSEINDLSHHVMGRLFAPHNDTTQNVKRTDRDNEIDNEFETGPRKKFISEKGVMNADESTAPSSGNSGTGSGTNGENMNGSGDDNKEGSGSNDDNDDNFGDDDFKGDEEGGDKKKSRALPFKSKLPKKATDVLKRWFLNNINNPYPTHEIKENLSKATGLSRKQIQNWFTNSRKRFLEPLKKKINAQKSGTVSPHNDQHIGGAEPKNDFVSKPHIPEPMVPNMEPEPVNLSESISSTINNPQIMKPFPQIPTITTAAPVQSIINPNIIKPIPAPQKINVAPMQLPNQPLLYQLPIGNLPSNNGSFLILPYYVPQPQMNLQYRQPELIPMGTPMFQIQQPNIQNMPNLQNLQSLQNLQPLQNMQNMPNLQNMSNLQGMQNLQGMSSNMPNLQPVSNLQSLPNLGSMPIIDQNGMMTASGLNPSYLMPLQPNLMEMRPATTQNLSTNFNTINNNVYNNISSLGNMGGLSSWPNMSPVGAVNGIPNMQNAPTVNAVDLNFGRGMEKVMPQAQNESYGNRIGGIFEGNSNLAHMRNLAKTDMDPAGFQTRKFYKDANNEAEMN